MLGTFPVEAWFDCGTLESLLETNRHLLEGVSVPGHRRCRDIGEDSVVIPPVYVAPTARVRCSVIAQNMIIGNQAGVEDVLLEDTLIGYQAMVKGRAGRLNVGDMSEVMG